MASPPLTAADVARAFGGTFPEGTRGILVDRVIPTPGRRGGRRERVDYLSPEQCASRLHELAPGRYRIACIGSRGPIKQGARVLEVREDGSIAIVRARTSSDYPRSRGARKKSRLRAKLKAARARLRATTHAKHGAVRKVERRDAQIARERAAYARREERVRAEARAARREARAALRARDKAFAYAEAQVHARDAAEQRASAEARARSDAEAEVARLRAEVQTLQRARPKAPAPPRRPRAVEVPLGAAAPRPMAVEPNPQPSSTTAGRPDAAVPRVEPRADDAHLRQRLHAQELALATARRDLARYEALLRNALAQRDAAQADARRSGMLLGLVGWGLGSAALVVAIRRAMDALGRAHAAEEIAAPSAAPVASPPPEVRFTPVAAWAVATYRAPPPGSDPWRGGPFRLGERPGGAAEMATT